MSRFRFELAGETRDAALRRRMAEDRMEGLIAVSFRREPSYFAACRLQGDRVQTIACIDGLDDSLIGLGCRASGMAYVNAEARRVGYLADLRCHPAYRRGTLLARGYRYLQSLHVDDPLPFYTTVVYEGNEPALDALCSARAGLPAYRPWGRLLTPAIRLDRELPSIPVTGIDFALADAGDWPQILVFLHERMRQRQFAPAWCEDDIRTGRLKGLAAEDFVLARRDGRLVGTLALWDQSAIRQTHVERYRGWLGALRPAINIWRSVAGARRLPGPGERIPHAYLACFAVSEDDLAIAQGLLRFAYRRARRSACHYVIGGLHERDPLAACLREYKQIHAAGCLFVVHYPPDRAAVEAVDDRVPYLEVGCL